VKARGAFGWSDAELCRVREGGGWRMDAWVREKTRRVRDIKRSNVKARGAFGLTQSSVVV